MENLFIGEVATGIVYCDRSKQENGDYKELAITLRDSGKTIFYDTSDKIMTEYINKHAQKHQLYWGALRACDGSIEHWKKNKRAVEVSDSYENLKGFSIDAIDCDLCNLYQTCAYRCLNCPLSKVGHGCLAMGSVYYYVKRAYSEYKVSAQNKPALLKATDNMIESLIKARKWAEEN